MIIVWPLINFVLFVGLLWVLLRKKLALFWADRSASIAKTLEQSREAFVAAGQRIVELDRKLEHIEGEIDALQIGLSEEGAAEKAQIVSQARLEAERIRNEAVEIGRQEVQRAREQLRYDMVVTAMTLAETELVQKLDAAQQRKLLAQSAERLERGLA